jgi:hypothetical protein
MLLTGGRSTRRLRRRLSAAAVVAIVGVSAVLVGCTSPEPAPIDEPTTEPTSDTPTRTASPTPTETPTASPGSVEAQLHAATIAFYAAVEESYRKLDPTPLRAVVVPNSRAGGGYVDDIATVKRKGHRFSDIPEYEVTEFVLEPQDADPSQETVRFTLSADYSEEVDGEGRVVEKFPAGSAGGRIEFMRKDGKWLVLSQRFVE